VEYIKDFDGWNRKKKEINYINDSPFFYEGEIWWCSLGVNIGVEMDGKDNLFERPVLIIKKVNLQSALVAPITSSFRYNQYVYPLTTISSSVSLSQTRSISNKRLSRKITRISIKEYAHIIIRMKYILTAQNETPPNGGESRGPQGA
jgi:mRNA interferase MazF